MIRVLHVLGGLNRGGAETIVLNLYRSIDKTKVQFDFIIHSKNETDYTSEILNLGGRIFIFPKFKGYNLIEYRNVWKKFLREHSEYKILHSHVRSYASIFLPIAKNFGLKTIIHSHSTSNGKGMKSTIKDLLQKPLANQADYLFSCSTEAGRWLFGDDSINNDNYYLVRNSIDVEKYRFNEDIRNEYRRKLNLTNQTVYCHVGRLSEPKNHMFLLEIFKGIIENDSNSILLIIGDGELKIDIEKKIIDLKLQNKVITMGSRDDVEKILQASDVFLFPSLWEGLPVSVVEAQAAGLPSLVSNRVTKEVDISPSIKYLPIDEGIDIWVNEAIRINKVRFLDSADYIKKAGYDIFKTANWLSIFYRSLYYD